MAASSLNLGSINQGEYRTLTFVFKQSTVATDPVGGAFLNMTPPGGSKSSYTAQLTHTGGGTYTFGFNLTTPGWWTGTIYTTAGQGQDSQPFAIEVVGDANYN